MITRFEEISNNAWPAIQTIQYDGWILRFANGVTKRSNSVSILYPSALPPDEKINFCEKLYLSQGITPCFKVTAIPESDGIDEILEEQGYYIHSVISFMVKDIAGIPAEPTGEIRMADTMDDRWIDDFIRMNRFDPARKSTYVAIMDHLALPKCLVSVIRDGKTVGVGLGVAEGEYIGLFDLVVDSAWRRSGLGALIVENLLRWGKRQGATTAYLQVLSDNDPAIRLYENMGFLEAYRYWYRMKT